MASVLQDDFDNIGWAVSVENNIEAEESVYFIKFDTDINPRYRPLSPALRRQSTQSLVTFIIFALDTNRHSVIYRYIRV